MELLYPASEYQAHIERRDNVYVGVGITLEQREDETGLEIVELAEGGGQRKPGSRSTTCWLGWTAKVARNWVCRR